MAKKVVRLTESDLMNIVEQCVYEYQQTLINEGRLGNLARTAALGAGLAGGILGGMNGANAQSQYPNLSQDQIHTVDSLINQRSKFRQAQDSIANQNNWKTKDGRNCVPSHAPLSRNFDDYKNFERDTSNFFDLNDSVKNVNNQLLQNIGDINNCHYEVTIRINKLSGGHKYHSSATINGKVYRVSYGPTVGGPGSDVHDTVCIRNYNTLDEVINNVPLLLMKLAKDEEYNDTDYKISIQNTTLPISEHSFQFFASLEKNHSKNEIKKEAQEELQYFIQQQHKGFEDLLSNHKYRMAEKGNGYGGYSGIKTTVVNGDVKTIYTDGEKEYIWDDNTMKYVELPKKARF